MIDLSMKFSSSRTFPGQGQLTKARMVSARIPSTFLLISRAYFLVKYSARGGMSSGRSRNGGTVIGNTFRR